MNNRDPFSLRPRAAHSNSPISLLQRNPSSGSGHGNTSTSQQQPPPPHTSTSASDSISASTNVGATGLSARGSAAVAGGGSSVPVAGTGNDDMGFQVPRNVPTFDAPQRSLEDNVWGSSGRSRFPATAQGAHEGVGAYAEKMGMGGLFGDGGGKDLPMYKDKPYYAQKRRRGLWEKYRPVIILLGGVGLLFWWLGLFSSGDGGSSSTPVGTGPGKQKSSSWLTGGSNKGKKGSPDWDKRREKVKEIFKKSWNGYETYAWGFDEYHPKSHKGRQMVDGGMGWIIVDALDTLILMNMTTELTHAREWISTQLDYEVDHDVNTFETTIRMLGGLLSAQYLTTEFPHYAPLDIEEDSADEDLYLEKATDLAERLLGAYESQSGVPYASVNLKTMTGIPSHADLGASSTAEATSLQLEMKYLAKLTGEANYWEAAENVMRVVDDNGAKDGLLPIFIYADKGTFKDENIRLGSRGDSYYEYLIKQYLQTSKEEPIYLEMWEESMRGIRKHLISYSEPSNFVVLGERPNGLDMELFPKMDHLVCFMPGTIALAATGGETLADAKIGPNWGQKNEDDLALAEELMKTCIGMYKSTKTGLSPEIAHFKLADPPVMLSDPKEGGNLRRTPDDIFDGPDYDGDEDWRTDFIVKPADAHNLQRPETVESLFYMWRITGEEKYRDWGWDMFQAFVKYTDVGDDAGFTSLQDVTTIPPPQRDNMESFWLAETLKYFYLLFGPDDVLPLTDMVLNTEAHPMPVFEMGKLFKTGWQRKQRDEDGQIRKQLEESPEDLKVQEEEEKGASKEKDKREREDEEEEEDGEPEELDDDDDDDDDDDEEENEEEEGADEVDDGDEDDKRERVVRTKVPDY